MPRTERHPELRLVGPSATATQRPGTRRIPRVHTYLRRTSGTGRGSATHCPNPRRRRYRRKRTAADCPIEAVPSPCPALARSSSGPGLWPRLARLLIANLINAHERGEAGKWGAVSPTLPSLGGEGAPPWSGVWTSELGERITFPQLLTD